MGEWAMDGGAAGGAWRRRGFAAPGARGAPTNVAHVDALRTKR